MRYKLPDGWEEIKLGDAINFRRGYDLTKTSMNKKGKYPVIGSNGVIGRHDKYKLTGPVVTIGRSGNIGRPFYYKTQAWPHNTTLYIDNFKGNNAIYIYYLLQVLNLRNYGGGSAVPTLNRNHIHPILIKLPPLQEQKAIADTLSTLDDKIELNNKINENLEAQAQAIFKHWFIDFEFPDENGNPYKSSGGEMVESELGMIPKGWEVVKLKELIELHDSKRIPLSKKQRGRMDKIYPYYGATSIIDYVEDYIFNGTFVLMGEDGTVVDIYGYPILQYVWGKIWVNNHAHVITGKNGLTVEYIYMILKNVNVANIVTGAVQKKINQRNLKGLKVLHPTENILWEYINMIAPVFHIRKSLETQTQTLSQLRDTLLPKLISGEIRIPLDKI